MPRVSYGGWCVRVFWSVTLSSPLRFVARPPDVSERTVQRRFVAATGLTRSAIRQIGRARQAAVLIQEGLPAHDVVYRLGYFDQPHLARSLIRYIWRTATQLRVRHLSEPLSLLYKT